MNPNFKCFVDFNNNRYDIEIDDNINNVSFNNNQLINKLNTFIEVQNKISDRFIKRISKFK